MEDEFLTDKQYRDEIGVEPEFGRALWQGVFARVGYALNPEGKNGSGVFVKTMHGRRALLTSRHVAEPLVERGAGWIGGHNYDAADPDSTRLRRVAMCRPVTEFLLSRTCDAALIYAPDDLGIRSWLDAPEWDPRTPIDFMNPGVVIAAGQPADPEWKAKPRVDEKVIDEMKTMLMWTKVTMVIPDGGLLELFAPRTKGVMPASYEGMSGGPLFSTTGRLLGILDDETEPTEPGAIYALQRPQWMDIYLGDS